MNYFLEGVSQISEMEREVLPRVNIINFPYYSFPALGGGVSSNVRGSNGRRDWITSSSLNRLKFRKYREQDSKFPSLLFSLLALRTIHADSDKHDS